MSQDKLLWSDEFSEQATAGGKPGQPDPANWVYDTGSSGWGNSELETYCAWGSDTAPCNAAHPSAYVGSDGYLHIVAGSLGGSVYTSARLKTQGIRSFRFGRIEARIEIPQGQGIWPAFWMLGDDIATSGWPSCGEIDIMENIGKTPSVAYGTIHYPGGYLTGQHVIANQEKLASEFHVYGLTWAPGRVEFYFDTPAGVYATYTPADLPKGAVWPFDGRKFFLILNLAVGGKWPGDPDATTRFPQQMLVDYVRVYGPPEAVSR